MNVSGVWQWSSRGAFCLFQKYLKSWRDDSAIKNSYCSSRRPEFSSQLPHGGWPPSTQDTHSTHTYMDIYLYTQNKQIYIFMFFYSLRVFILAFPTINMASEYQVPFFLFELPFCLTNSLLSFQTLFLSRSPMFCIALHLEHTLINICWTEGRFSSQLTSRHKLGLSDMTDFIGICLLS